MKGHASQHYDMDTFLCCPVKAASPFAAVFIQDRLSRLSFLSRVNFYLSILCLVVVAGNVVTFILNGLSFTKIRVAGDDSSLKSMMDVYNLDLPFHLFEFWMTFVFAVLEILIIVFSPRSVSDIYSRPLILKIVIFFNVVSAFVPAMLICFSLEIFEVPSHELEYGNEVLVAFLNVVITLKLSKSSESKLQAMELYGREETDYPQQQQPQQQQQDGLASFSSKSRCCSSSCSSSKGSLSDPLLKSEKASTKSKAWGDSANFRRFVEWSCIILSPVLALLQIFIYNEIIVFPGVLGAIGAEALAHYFEFVFSIMSACISFVFCIDNKLLCDRKQTELIKQWAVDDCEARFVMT
eukprot:TRINITY_DN4744_c0_g1_i1.p1 TRINITY_DN4744_c0_g1~~TRINITY_DN4744_c0_g1_i1.p1  ORF type:complete len:352 (-),score=38.03 TRINITY_DN4744_c0_g1_i1:280-1335(-)